jgi:TonB family protein
MRSQSTPPHADAFQPSVDGASVVALSTTTTRDSTAATEAQPVNRNRVLPGRDRGTATGRTYRRHYRARPRLEKVEPGFEKGVEGAAGGVGAIDLAPPSPPPAPVRIGGSISAPKLVRRVEPDYPAAAQAAQIQGIVILEATVDEQGAVDAVKVLRSNSLLDAAATTAVKQWKYAPLLLNGRATPFVLTVTVSFDLTR